MGRYSKIAVNIQKERGQPWKIEISFFICFPISRTAMWSSLKFAVNIHKFTDERDNVLQLVYIISVMQNQKCGEDPGELGTFLLGQNMTVSHVRLHHLYYQEFQLLLDFHSISSKNDHKNVTTQPFIQHPTEPLIGKFLYKPDILVGWYKSGLVQLGLTYHPSPHQTISP